MSSYRPSARELHEEHAYQRALDRRERKAVEAAVLAAEEKAMRRMQAVFPVPNPVEDTDNPGCFW